MFRDACIKPNQTSAFGFQKSYSLPIDLDFQKRYATTVLELEQLNKDLNKVLHEVQQFCCEVSNIFPVIAPEAQHRKIYLRHISCPALTFKKKNVSAQLAPDQGMVPADHPTELRRRCEDEAQQMVQLSNSLKDGQQSVTNPSLTHLISRLTALLLQIKVTVR